MTKLHHLLDRFARDTKAVSAVEFAMLLPVLLLLLLGSFDIARAVDVKTKTSLLSRTISDFVSQDDTATPAQLALIVQAARSVMYPYPFDASVLNVTVESIRQSTNNPNQYVVDWSYKPSRNPAATNADQNTAYVPPVPTVIRTTVDYTYNLRFVGFLGDRLGFDAIQMQSINYMAPRWGTPVQASGFPG